jgi:hypothetical protein
MIGNTDWEGIFNSEESTLFNYKKKFRKYLIFGNFALAAWTSGPPYIYITHWWTERAVQWRPDQDTGSSFVCRRCESCNRDCLTAHNYFVKGSHICNNAMLFKKDVVEMLGTPTGQSQRLSEIRYLNHHIESIANQNRWTCCTSPSRLDFDECSISPLGTSHSVVLS